MADLIDVLQNIHKALGISDWSREQAAGQNLAGQPGGSVMANYQEPTATSEWLKANPLMQTVLDVLKMGLPSPTDAGGGSKAVMGPITTAEQKQIVKAIFRGDPGVLQHMRDSIKQFNISVPDTKPSKIPESEMSVFDKFYKRKLEFQQKHSGRPLTVDEILQSKHDPVAGNYGIARTVNPLRGDMVIHPNTLRGKAPSGHIYGDKVVGKDPDLVSTALHEALHGFNTPLAMETPIDKAQKVINMIYPQLSEMGKRGVLSTSNPTSGMKESMSYLGETALRGSGGENADALYQALKEPMYEATERQGQNYLKQWTPVYGGE